MAVSRIAVLGSGLMGRGIAYAASVGGFETVLFDVSASALEKALAQVEADLREGVARGKLTPDAATAARARIVTASSVETAVHQAHLVIEAVPENIALKLDTFAHLDSLCPPEVVLATNTS
ncbi:MAG TPA: 3-hydroxyacyl-CoA dehydrogenase NAD-binding domain-containing protein, partial [Vicinamibacteria bacterium]|nr:3-hydroxyacyl-CoA dehydrogenase NAD-binding domain-containing protein [Vicinamibacteria bacterium]